MAIYGSLSELPFPEIMNMLMRRSGRLTVSGAKQGPLYVLHLQQGCLTGFLINRRETNDPMHVRDAFQQLMNLEVGNFEFESMPPFAGLRPLSMPVKQLLLSTATVIDELAAYRAHFPHPQVKFHATGPIEEHLPTDLLLFWERAEPLLQFGISSEDLADRLDIQVGQVQLYLYKLRSTGKVRPVRSYVAASRYASAGTHEAEFHTSAERPRLLQRLLRSLSSLGRVRR